MSAKEPGPGCELPEHRCIVVDGPDLVETYEARVFNGSPLLLVLDGTQKDRVRYAVDKAAGPNLHW